MGLPIVDLHCDLLSYLEVTPERTPLDPASRASYPQLKSGNVHLQVLAIFSKTQEGSTRLAESQVSLFQNLILRHPNHFALFSPEGGHPHSSVQVIPAFENASCFSEENEPIGLSLQRLDQMFSALQGLFYIGMTWDGENRFGGGVGANVGLKEDGKRLLEWMSSKHIPIDFSHTSDHLAEDILNYNDQRNLNLSLLASHSNFRSITDLPRNLPDWLAQEIIQRKGIIGLNLFAPFIRKGDPSVLMRHVEYALSLNAENSLCFGADFFCDADFPSLKDKYQTTTAFFPEYGNASLYPKILEQIRERLHVSTEQLKKISSENALHFRKRSG